jgi:hypothetical protein
MLTKHTKEGKTKNCKTSITNVNCSPLFLGFFHFFPFSNDGWLFLSYKQLHVLVLCRNELKLWESLDLQINGTCNLMLVLINMVYIFFIVERSHVYMSKKNWFAFGNCKYEQWFFIG